MNLNSPNDPEHPVRASSIEGELFRSEPPQTLVPLRRLSRMAAVGMGGFLTAVGAATWMVGLFRVLTGGFAGATEGWEVAITLLALPLAIGLPMLRSGLAGRDLFQERQMLREVERRELRDD